MRAVQVGVRRRNGLPVCGADSVSRAAFTCGGFTTRSYRSASPSKWRKASLTRIRSSAGRSFAWRPGTPVIWIWCPPTGGATRRAPREITQTVHEEHREQLDELEEAWGEIATLIESWNERAPNRVALHSAQPPRCRARSRRPRLARSSRARRGR